MSSKRKEKKAAQRRQLEYIETQIERARPYVDAKELKQLAKNVKTVAAREKSMRLATSIDDYVSQQEENIAYWRDRGMQIRYGSVKFHNSLKNMEKYHLIKRYYELKKRGWIKVPGNLDYYDDVADWALENFSNDQLAEVIQLAEDNYGGKVIKFDTEGSYTLEG